ncbi:hypothetical protein R1flu_025729 [Riccia fluitans]|uniref:non-specific serine/threonine protein kinase n=1 Tax=Riccia fluitans TaxID=41844 RepID=A0ABD1XYS2_9MARC
MAVAEDSMELEPEQNTSMKLFSQGAEARIYETSFMGRRAVVKERFSKKYRHPVLDVKLTSKRLISEARIVAKARRLGVATPALYAVDTVTASLTYEFIPGPSVKEVLLQSGPIPSSDGKIEEIAKQIGKAIAKLHDGGVVHGDLTTSNMLISPHTNQLVLIDFGLSYTSVLPEDKGVDLYVLERALISLHSANGDIMSLVISAYKQSSKLWSSTLNKLAAVRMRGRKRVMIG